jgi:hypothetical protein
MNEDQPTTASNERGKYGLTDKDAIPAYVSRLRK